METPVQKKRRGRWSAEQKLAVLEEWRNGLPVEEVCRKHGVAASMVYRWRRDLERGLTDRGELVPKSQVAAWQRRVDELEKALGRKALEVEVLKKVLRAQGAPVTRRDVRWVAQTTPCAIALICRTLEVARSWVYYRRPRPSKAWPLRRPELTAAIRLVLKGCPATYGYRRVHALLRRRGIDVNAKTVYHRLRQQQWLASLRQQRPRSGRRHEGQVTVAVPNQRWASDITGLRTWDGHNVRLAVILDCADRMVLAWRLARRLTAEEVGELVREAVFRRFGLQSHRPRGIEFLSDNGPEYIAATVQQVLNQFGLVGCRTPCRSPQSNGAVEVFFGSFKRDYVYQSCLETRQALEEQLPRWVQDYNEVAPHSALGMRSPGQFYQEWMVNNKRTPVQN